MQSTVSASSRPSTMTGARGSQRSTPSTSPASTRSNAPVRRHELEPVARQVPLQKPASLGLGVGKEQCCGHDATVDVAAHGEKSSFRTIVRRLILS